MGPMEDLANELFAQMIELFFFMMSLGVGAIAVVTFLIFLILRLGNKKAATA